MSFNNLLKILIRKYILFSIGTLFVVLSIIYTKFFWGDYPLLDITPESLLLPTIFSVTVSLTIPTVMKEKLKIENPVFHDLLWQIIITVTILFTASTTFLCFDIYPIPYPTTRWIWVWAIFFVFGWLLLLIYFILFMVFLEIDLPPKRKQMKQAKLTEMRKT